MESSDGLNEEEDVTMADLDWTATSTATSAGRIGAGAEIPHITATTREQKALARGELKEISDRDDTCPPGFVPSGLHRHAGLALPLTADSEGRHEGAERAPGDRSRGVNTSIGAVSTDIVVIPGTAGSQGQRFRFICVPPRKSADPINLPVICATSVNTPHCSLASFSTSLHHTHRNPILNVILGDLDPVPGSGGTINPGSNEQHPSAQREQRNSAAIDLDHSPNTRTQGSLSPKPIIPYPLSASPSLPNLSLALTLSQPRPSRRPAAIPVALSSPGLFAGRPTSLSLASPRHSPYAHPSARLISASSDALRSARLRLNSANMLSPSSSYPTSSTPPAPSTPPGQTTSGQSTPLAPSPSSMSMSKRRRAPEWPSPRSYHAQSQSLSYPSHPTGPPSAFSRDLAQTIRTPAALRVPPTPDYSPAFYRSGFAGHPPAEASTSGARAPHGLDPLDRNHSPFSSAPPLTTSRMVEPPSPPLASPSPNIPSSAAKKQRVNLLGIPRGWVIEQLNKRAGQFWHDPSSSDVRILVPIPRSKLPQQVQQSATPRTQDSAQSFHSNQPGHAVWPATPLVNMVSGGTDEAGQGLLGHVKSGHSAANGRRGSLPGKDDVVALVFPLHQDYLITQSSLFRSLFAPTVPAQYLEAPGPSSPRTVKGARRLPTPPGAHPAILLPLPDPASFSVLVHWLYWGDITALESALSRGLVEWQGVVKNVHYLGMDDNVKRVLGKWWRRWIKTDEGRVRSAAGGSGMNKKEGWGDSDDEDGDAEEELEDDDEQSARGRAGTGVESQLGERGRIPGAEEADDGGVSGLLRAL